MQTIHESYYVADLYLIANCNIKINISKKFKHFPTTSILWDLFIICRNQTLMKI